MSVQDDIDRLTAQIAAIKAARASGLKEAAFGERKMTYRPDIEMRDILGDLEAELAQLQGSLVRKRRTYYTTSSKGL